MQEKEIWKDVPGYEGYYKVSNLGNVKSLDRIVPHPRWGRQFWKGRIIKSSLDKYGYPRLSLRKYNKAKFFTIHRLVAVSFIPNLENKPQVNHRDGNKTNNNVINLEWVSEKENVNHAYDTGLHRGRRGIESPHSKVVYQYSLEGKFIDKYYGCCEANRLTGIDRSSISLAVNGKSNKAGGFIWSYNYPI